MLSLKLDLCCFEERRIDMQCSIIALQGNRVGGQSARKSFPFSFFTSRRKYVFLHYHCVSEVYVGLLYIRICMNASRISETATDSIQMRHITLFSNCTAAGFMSVL